MFCEISARVQLVLGSFKCRLQWAAECAAGHSWRKGRDGRSEEGRWEMGRGLGVSICIMAATHCSGNGNPKLASFTCRCPWVVLMTAWAACASLSLTSAPFSLSSPHLYGSHCFSLSLVNGSCLHCRVALGACRHVALSTNEHELSPASTSTNVFHFNSTAINKLATEQM